MTLVNHEEIGRFDYFRTLVRELDLESEFNFCRGGVPFLKEQRSEWSERVAQ